MSEPLPVFDMPASDKPYTVIWYENGRLLVRGFHTYIEAHDIYDQLIRQQRFLRERIKGETHIYLMWLLQGYEE